MDAVERVLDVILPYEPDEADWRRSTPYRARWG